MIPDSVRQIMSLFFFSSSFVHSIRGITSEPKIFVCTDNLPLPSPMGIIIDEIIVVLTLTAGVAVLLTIITYFSTPILTAIFGDGSLEVYINWYINNCVESVPI